MYDVFQGQIFSLLLTLHKDRHDVQNALYSYSSLYLPLKLAKEITSNLIILVKSIN